MKYLPFVLFGICSFVSCRNDDDERNYCYQKTNEIAFDKIPASLDTQDLNQLRRWYLIHRTKGGVGVFRRGETKESNLWMIFLMDSCTFKTRKQHIYALSDSAIYKDEINVELVIKGYENLAIFSKLDVSGIFWQEDPDRVRFENTNKDNQKESINYNYLTKQWSD